MIIKNKDYTKLNLACSDDPNKKFPPPWLNTDIKEGVADYVTDIKTLPNNWTSQFDEVRASHVFEHIYLNECQPTLTEWVRVLKPGGVLRIIVPDLDIVMKCLIEGYDKKMRPSISGVNATPVLAQIYGFLYEDERADDRWRHRMIYNQKTLIEALGKQTELENIVVYPQVEDPARLLGIKDDSQNQFSLCVKAIKKHSVL